MISNKKINVISFLSPSAIKQNELEILAMISLGPFRQYILCGTRSASCKDRHTYIYVCTYTCSYTHEFRSLYDTQMCKYMQNQGSKVPQTQRAAASLVAKLTVINMFIISILTENYFHSEKRNKISLEVFLYSYHGYFFTLAMPQLQGERVWPQHCQDRQQGAGGQVRAGTCPHSPIPLPRGGKWSWTGDCGPRHENGAVLRPSGDSESVKDVGRSGQS